jgi:hypothetical protein
MTEERRRPVAVCTKCGAQTSHAEHQGRQCYRRIDGKRCRGRLKSVADEDEWEKCSACAAAGWIEGERCERCDGHGWLHVVET